MKSFTVLRGRGAKSFGPAIFFYFVAPPLPIINDQSLRHMILQRTDIYRISEETCFLPMDPNKGNQHAAKWSYGSN